MSAATRNRPAFLMASIRFAPGGNFLAFSSASDGISIMSADIAMWFFIRVSACCEPGQPKANCWWEPPSNRLRSPLGERDRISGTRTCAGRSQSGLSRFLKAASEPERISDSGVVRSGKDTLMERGNIPPCLASFIGCERCRTLRHRWLPMAGRDGCNLTFR
jgi:hypothetical protein